MELQSWLELILGSSAGRPRIAVEAERAAEGAAWLTYSSLVLRRQCCSRRMSAEQAEVLAAVKVAAAWQFAEAGTEWLLQLDIEEL